MIKLTERDEKLFDFLFKFRYANSNQICEYLSWSYEAFRKRVSNLIKYGYITSKKYDYINKKLYMNGIEARRNHQINAYRKNVILNDWSFRHHMVITDIYIFFLKNYNLNENFITSEREMYWKRIGILDKKKRFKMPDLVIKKDDELIAIEYERSMKNDSLIRDVFTNYSLYTSYYCVRYICKSKGIKEKILRIAEEEGKTFIKAYTIDEFYKNKVDVIGF